MLSQTMMLLNMVYDVEDFLQGTLNVASGPTTLFIASAANPCNPMINRRLKKQHLFFEYNDRPQTKGRKPTDATKALFNLRKQIISGVCPKLPISDLDRLAERTRGYLKADIENSTRLFIEEGKLPTAIKHPTNTCDPFTGNWFENLIDPYSISASLINLGYQSKVLPGYFNRSGSTTKTLAKLVLNALIRIAGKFGLKTSPYYAVIAHRQQKTHDS